MNRDFAKIVAKALFYASIQSSWGSVEMSSKFSVLNFSKDQLTLQRAADALRNYIYIALIWTGATMLALYSSYGVIGAWIGLISNAIMMAWIILSYMKAFKEAAANNNLEVPTVFSTQQWKLYGGITAVLLGGMAYMNNPVKAFRAEFA